VQESLPSTLEAVSKILLTILNCYVIDFPLLCYQRIPRTTISLKLILLRGFFEKTGGESIQLFYATGMVDLRIALVPQCQA